MKPNAMLVLACLAACASAPCLAQSNLAAEASASGPQAALDRFLALNAASALAGDEGRALMAGELARSERPTWGPLPRPDRVVLLADGTAVARFPAQGEDRPDIYLYLRSAEEDRWVITAGRSLALTGVLTELRRALRAAGNLTAEQQAALGNVELTLASDAQLRAWLSEHRREADRLRAIAQAAAQGGREMRVETPEAQALLRSLHLNTATVSRDGVVRLSIGGMVDNEVGFLYAADPAAVPSIDPSDHIWIEPLGDGWYLFKTT